MLKCITMYGSQRRANYCLPSFIQGPEMENGDDVVEERGRKKENKQLCGTKGNTDCSDRSPLKRSSCTSLYELLCHL